MNNQNRFSKVFGLIFGILGLVFFIVGVAFLYCYPLLAGDSEFKILGYMFSMYGGVFLVIGLCSFLVALRHKRKVQRLMRDGKCYNADIVRTYEKPYMRVNFRYPFVVECGYQDNRGRSYLVKSGNVWLNSFVSRESDIKARVWVNPDNPKDYYVEVYTTLSNANPDMKFDFDYR